MVHRWPEGGYQYNAGKLLELGAFCVCGAERAGLLGRVRGEGTRVYLIMASFLMNASLVIGKYQRLASSNKTKKMDSSLDSSCYPKETLALALMLGCRTGGEALL